MRNNQKKVVCLLLCGMVGSILMGCSDWLMIYGDPSFRGSLAWLTEGAAQIPAWRNSLAMLMTFPAVGFYAVGLFGIRSFLPEEKHRKAYGALTVLGMTPWMALHLFYTMILFLFAWLSGNGYESVAFGASEARVRQFLWLVPVGEAVIILPFLYLFAVFVTGRSCFPRWMAFNNPLILYVVLKTVTVYLPASAGRLAFINGLMSECMLIWFAVFLLAHCFRKTGKQTV